MMARYIQASFHQGNAKYHGMARQCMANALSSLSMAQKGSPQKWNTDTLNVILDNGDNIYKCSSVNSYMMLEDLPKQCVLYENLKLNNILSGSINQKIAEGPYFTLENAIDQTLTDLTSYCLITIGKSNPSYSCCIIRNNTTYYFFDPHSRNEIGMPTPDGFATLTEYYSTSALCQFVHQLSAMLFMSQMDVQFEIASVTLSPPLTIDSICSDDQSFDGFSEVSEGEVTSKLYVLNADLEQSFSISDVSSCSINSDTDSSDNIPLSLLQKRIVNDGTCTVISEPDDSVSDIYSSGSEYKFTALEKKLLNNELSESEISLSDDNLYYVPPFKKKKLKKVKNHRSNIIKRANTSTPKYKLNPVGTDSQHSGLGTCGIGASSFIGVDGVVGGNVMVGAEVMVGVDNSVMGTVDVEGVVGAEIVVGEDARVGVDGVADGDGIVDGDIIIGVDSVMGEVGTIGVEGIVGTNCAVSGGGIVDFDSLVGGDDTVGVEGMVSANGTVSGYGMVGVEDMVGANVVVGGDGRVGVASVMCGDVMVDADISVVDDSVIGGIGTVGVGGIVGTNCAVSGGGMVGVEGMVVFDSMVGGNDTVVVESMVSAYGAVSGYGMAGVEDMAGAEVVVDGDGIVAGHCFISGDGDRGESIIVGDCMTEVDSMLTGDSMTDGDASREQSYKGRKRTRNPDKWKRNVLKRQRNSGEEFIDDKGIRQHAKYVKPGCGTKCRFKCHTYVNREERENIFHKFWGLGDVTQHRQFILKHSEPKRKANKTVPGSSRRSNSFMYTLPHNENSIRVCQTFFLHTLNITGQMVQTAFKKSVELPGVCGLDKRGKHNTRPNRTTDDKVNYIKDHIHSFPTVESHYCRKDSKKMYLCPGLSLPKMYSLYCEKCSQNDIQPVKLSAYRSVFDHNFNLSFFKPVKDQCDTCNMYRNSSASLTDVEKVKYESHLKNKIAARENKEHDKMKAKSEQDDTFIASCFDLEEVLMTPKGFESTLYYKRRLNTFNFSVYDLGTSEAHCYLWNETLAGRGACEISSCVYMYIQHMAERGKKKFVFFSDNCGSQNKNKYYISMLWYAMQKFNLISIEHKYLEKGHTQNENDSVHAAIETASRHVSVYTTAQWAAIIRLARPKAPYFVKELDVSEFLNFKKTVGVLKFFYLDMERQKVYWSEVRQFCIGSEDPNTILLKYEYDGPIHYLNLVQRLRRAHVIEHPENIVLERLHNDQLPITWDKYNDLISLCRNKVIPTVHHVFYLLLPHEENN